MKNIILKSVLVLALGVAPGAGLAQTEMLKKKPSQQTEGQTQMPAEPGTQEQGATTKPRTDGQAGTQVKKRQQTEGQAQAPTDQGAEQQTATGKKQTHKQTGTYDTAKTSNQPSNETTGSANVTTEQRTEIKQVITETKAEPVRDMNFEMNVGVPVPRTIELQPLPRIVKLVPRYKGYSYFLLAGGRIIIVDPDSLEIVLVIA